MQSLRFRAARCVAVRRVYSRSVLSGGLLLLLQAQLAFSAAPAAAGPLAHLRKGAAHYEAGEFAAAQAELAPIANTKLPVRDYVLYYLGQAAAYSGDKTAAAGAFHALARLSSSRLAAMAAWREADCLFDLGRPGEAARAYEQLLKKNAAGADAAVAKSHIAEAAAAAGRTDVALVWFRRVYVEHPTHPLADAAFARMTTLGGKEPAITPDERVRRANTLSDGRSWDRALEELAKVPQDVAQNVRDDADLALGMTRYKTRHDYAGAADALFRVAAHLSGERAAYAYFHAARSLSRANQDDEAIKRYRDVAQRWPTTRWAQEAQFLAGWLEFNRARYAQALPGLSELLKRYPRSSFADDATWYLGFANFLSDKFDDAAGWFDKLSRMPGDYTQQKAHYWRARVFQKKGQASEAESFYRQLAAEHPLSWYGLLSRARLAELGIELPVFDEGARGDVPPLGSPDGRLASDPVIVKADLLLAAQLPVEAGEELRRGEGPFIRKLGQGRAIPMLIDRYKKAGNWNRVYLLAESYSGHALRLPPLGEARKWWENAYPLAYRDLIEKYAPVGKNPAYYLYAIMRKESGYNPHDVSYADAIGLLQMIPPTSRRVAERIHRPYTDDVLYDPAGNIHFGAWYIGHLLEKFRGQIPIGAGSFNAGPSPTIRWLGRDGTRSMDEYVELCAYTQTREYQKLVTDNYAHYVYLYTGKPYIQPLTVDPSYIDNEINY
jgi:soluble lytic murein transglycosylase